MNRSLSILGACVLLVALPSVGSGQGGQNPNGELAMHCVPSDLYLYCPELTVPGQYLPVHCSEMDNDVLPEELGPYGYAYVVFCCYNITGITGVEYCVTGWPVVRGFPPALVYCPTTSLVLGDPFDGGGIQTFQGACLEPLVESGGIVAFGYAGGFNALAAVFTLSYCPSGYTYGGDPHNYFLDCSPQYREDPTVSEHGCTIGGSHTESIPYADCAAGVTVKRPVGGEEWEVGTQEAIKWTAGGLDNVRIEYGSNDGKAWTEIEASYSASETTYAWTIPDDPGVYSIKISDAADGDPFDLSEGTFEIYVPETVEVTRPVGGEEWEVGTQEAIEWSSTGIENVRIEYGTDDGKAWTEIESAYPAAGGTYPWTIPNNPGVYSIKISDAADGDPFDLSEGTFEIVPAATITVTAPVGGESWLVGSEQDITWTSENVDSVRIEYGDSTKAWNVIEPSVPAAPGSYAWTVLDDPGNWYIRICDAEDGEPCGLSAGTFLIYETVVLTSPVGGESWLVGSEQQITWMSQGVQEIGLVYGDFVDPLKPIVEPYPADKGMYPWTIPDDPGTWVMIIYDVDGHPNYVSGWFDIYRSLEISGCVDYALGRSPVPDVQMSLDAIGIHREEITGGGGSYAFADVEGGHNYTLTPWKADDVPPFTIMAYDAALCARVATGLPIPPSRAHPATHAESLACDINLDGQITNDDALNIARRAAGLPLVVASRSTVLEWIFEPEDRFYPDLQTSWLDQDFSAVLLGDVDGNWRPMAPLRTADSDDGIVVDRRAVLGKVEVVIRIPTTYDVVSMDCAITYDPDLLAVETAEVKSAFAGFTSVVNAEEVGRVYLCCYRPDPTMVHGYGARVLFNTPAVRGLYGDVALEGLLLNDQLMKEGPVTYITHAVPGGLGPFRPNPFNPETAVSYSLPQGEPKHTSLKIYNLHGQLVRTLVDEVQAPGEYSVQWDGRNEAGQEVSSGVFFCVLESGDLRQTQKLTLLK